MIDRVKILKFKVFFEGKLMPGVVSVNIEEVVNGLPGAQISVVGVPEILNIPRSTIVTIFAKLYPNDDNYYLIYEGQVVKVSYNLSDRNENYNVLCTGLLYDLNSVDLRPVDSIYIRNSNETTNEQLGEYYFYSGGKKHKLVAGQNKIFKNLKLSFFVELANKLKDGNYKNYLSYLYDLYSKTNQVFAKRAYEFKYNDFSYIASNKSNTLYFRVKLFLENIQNNLKNLFGNVFSQKSYTFRNVIDAFKQTFYYKELHFAAPTFVKSSNKFYRMALIPDIENNPPMLINTVYSDDIISMNITKNLSSEITRMITYGTYNSIIGQSNIPIYNIATYPDVNNLKVNDGVYSLGYTEEEQYTGVLKGVSSTDQVLLSMINKETLKYINTTKPNLSEGANLQDVENTENDYQQIINDFTVDLQGAAKHFYLSKKYSTRAVALNVYYNPRYLVGFSGIIIKKNFPIIIGTITSISHSITVNGAFTKLIFSNCRIIYNKDSEELKSFTGSLDYLFDQSVYGFDKIGKNLYSEILGNEKNIDESVFRYSSDFTEAVYNYYNKIINNEIKYDYDRQLIDYNTYNTLFSKYYNSKRQEIINNIYKSRIYTVGENSIEVKINE